MCMEKKKLNEDPNGWITLLKILAPFVLSAILSGVRADFQQIISNVWRGKNKTEAEEFAQSIALELGYDKSFLQALAKFIIEAGGFKKFIEKMKRIQDVEKKRKEKKIEWLKKVYAKGELIQSFSPEMNV